MDNNPGCLVRVLIEALLCPLCLTQRFIQFQQLAAQANGLHPLMQQAPGAEQQLQEQLRPAAEAVIADPASIQREGLLAKEVRGESDAGRGLAGVLRFSRYMFIYM